MCESLRVACLCPHIPAKIIQSSVPKKGWSLVLRRLWFDAFDRVEVKVDDKETTTVAIREAREGWWGGKTGYVICSSLPVPSRVSLLVRYRLD